MIYNFLFEVFNLEIENYSIEKLQLEGNNYIAPIRDKMILRFKNSKNFILYELDKIINNL